MSTYRVKYFGSLAVQPLEFTMLNVSMADVKSNITRSLAHYHPTYYHAVVWTDEARLVATFDTKLVVVEGSI